jgi:hypothetical protein
MLSKQSTTAPASQAFTGSTDIGSLEALARDAAQDQSKVSRISGQKPTLLDQLGVLQNQMEQIYEELAHTTLDELTASSAR